jgi:hypothetical protein
MKTKLQLLFTILMATVLTGCDGLLRHRGMTPYERARSEAKYNAVKKKIDAGDIETSKEHVINQHSYSRYLGLPYSNHTMPRKYELLAARNVINAFHGKTEIGLDDLYYLICAHSTMIDGYEWENEHGSPERFNHAKTILQFANSQVLTSYAYDKQFRESENSMNVYAIGQFRDIQDKIQDALRILLTNKISESGDRYEPIKCKLDEAELYEKEIDLIEAQPNCRPHHVACNSIKKMRPPYYICSKRIGVRLRWVSEKKDN